MIEHHSNKYPFGLRQFGFFGVLLLLVFSNFMFAHSLSWEKTATIFLAEILTLLIIGLFSLKKRYLLFEPIVVFSAYYFTIIPAAIYYIYTDFSTSIIVNSTTFNNSTSSLLLSAMAYYVFGYIFALAGYYLVRTKKIYTIDFDSKLSLPDSILNAVIIVFITVGLVNFFQNVRVVSGGNLFQYILNTAGRRYEFEGTGLTTVWYHFTWVALYCWFFKLLRNKTFSFGFLVFLLVGTMMKVSTGRITSTMVFVGSFFVIYYFVNLSRSGYSNNKRYILAFSLLAMGGGAFYFLRIMSALYFQGAFDLEMVKEFSSLEKLGYFAVDRGNVPHIPIFMKIIDSWGPDIGYLYGRSFYAWVLSIVPTGWISPEEYLISLKINKLWFSNIPGAGGLPPTGVGEMYANFGVYGPFLGMFFFGVLCGAMYNFMIHSKSYWVLAVYSQILLGFILIYPKTDFANLSPWYIAPILATIFFLKLITTILRTN